jgi:hypothetical protein
VLDKIQTGRQETPDETPEETPEETAVRSLETLVRAFCCANRQPETINGSFAGLQTPHIR